MPTIKIEYTGDVSELKEDLEILTITTHPSAINLAILSHLMGGEVTMEPTVCKMVVKAEKKDGKEKE